MMRIITRPSQYCGIEAPSTDTVIADESTHELRRSAAARPSGMPISTATINDAAIRISVYGSWLMSMVMTGWPVLNDRPMSPCARATA
jgi:hypothetical protein